MSNLHDSVERWLVQDGHSKNELLKKLAKKDS